jgi:predicted RNase H-like HicB family nuclease
MAKSQEQLALGFSVIMAAEWLFMGPKLKTRRIMELSAILTAAPEGGYVAFNPETGTTTQGETVEEALANLREATELYLEEFPLTVVGRPLLTTFRVAAHA